MSSLEAAYLKNPSDPVQVHRTVVFHFRPGQDHSVGRAASENAGP